MNRHQVGRSRAVSTIVGYTITLGITALLISGLIVAAGGFVQDQRERAVRAELEVIGNQLAADLSTADSLVRGAHARISDPSAIEINLTRDLPETAAGEPYVIEVRTQGVVLRTDSPSTEVAVRFPTNDDVTVVPTRVSGGDVQIVFDDSGGGNIGSLVVEDA